jgi:type I restriction enzyme S subunit
VTAELLLQEFQRVADEPNSVARLRRFVFALAMRGRLSNSELLAVPLPSDDGQQPPPRKSRVEPYELPHGWRWSATAEVGTARLGKMLDKAKNRGTPRRYLRNINVRWFDFDLSDVQLMPFEDAELTEFSLRAGDVLICEGGEPGRAAVWDARDADIYFQKAVHRVRLSPEVLPLFLVYYLRSASYEGRLAPHATGATFQHLTGQGLAKLPIPVPPTDEQQRIIAKVDELIALCDELDAAQTAREARRDLLRTTSLRNLVAPDEGEEHARFFLRHSPRMITKPEHIAGVRQAILDLAVRGRLVPQHPGDQAATELISAIVRRRGGRSASAQPPAMQVSLPGSWQATTLATACVSVTDGDHQPPPKTDTGIPFLVISDVRSGEIDYRGSRYVSEDYYKGLNTFHRPATGDVLYTLVGSYGIPVRVTSDDRFCVQRHIGILRPEPEVSQDYLAAALRSTCSFKQATDCATGIAQKTVPLRGLRRLAIPLPPLAEQHRIVAKVDELMAVCDELEQSLTTQQAERARLLEALLRKVLEEGTVEGQGALLNT